MEPARETGGDQGDPSDMDDQMDWMSSQLQRLIAEGQRALGKEIVVDTDDPSLSDEELVDDGDQGWSDEGTSASACKPASRFSYNARPTSPVKKHRSIQSASVATRVATKGSHKSSRFYPSLPQADEDSQNSLRKSASGIPSSEEYSYPDSGLSSSSQTPDLQTAMQRVREAYGLPSAGRIR